MGSFVLQDANGLGSLNISYGGTKPKTHREHVGYLQFVSLRRARLYDKLLQVIASYAASCHGCHIYFCPASSEISLRKADAFKNTRKFKTSIDYILHLLALVEIRLFNVFFSGKEKRDSGN